MKKLKPVKLDTLEPGDIFDIHTLPRRGKILHIGPMAVSVLLRDVDPEGNSIGDKEKALIAGGTMVHLRHRPE